VFANAALVELTSIDGRCHILADNLVTFCESIAHKILHSQLPGVDDIENLGALATGLSTKSGPSPQELQKAIFQAATMAGEALPGFLESLWFESRLSRLTEAALSHLMSAGDLGPQEARQALERLTKAIEDETARPEPSVVDRSVLSDWLGIHRRLILQCKPPLAKGWVERKELLSRIAEVLSKRRFLVIHGITKIGKSQLVSALVDLLKKTESYFWFTFSGLPTDTQLLLEGLAFWVGQRTAVWQVYEDLRTGRVSISQALERLANAKIDGALVILDNSHKQADKTLFEKIAHLVGDRWTASYVIAISEQKIPETVTAGSKHFHVEGLEAKEAIQFVQRRGVDLSLAMADFAMLAVQVGGHPLMLSAVAERLPRRPSGADIQEIQKQLPKISSVEVFLQALSNRVYFDLVKTDAQRNWLQRLAALSFSFTPDMAFAAAKLPPTLSVGKMDWNYLSSLILDEVKANHYSLLISLLSIGPF
jgi:hypothetical protein